MTRTTIGAGTLGPGDGTDGDDLLNGTSGDDTLAGLGGQDTLLGADGNDTLDGGSGDDVLAGGAGDDSLVGGDGFDIVDYSEATGTVISSQASASGDGLTAGGAGVDTLIGIEGVIGSAFNDSIIGNDVANWIRGGAGNDTLIGGLGNDTADYGDATSGVVAWLTGFVSGGAGSDQLSGFENLDGSAFGDELRGAESDNRLRGLGGDDTLRGEDGNDTLEGSAGNDRLEGGFGDDQLSGGDGNDRYLIETLGAHATVTDSGGAADGLLLPRLVLGHVVAYLQGADLHIELRDGAFGDALMASTTVLDQAGTGRVEQLVQLDANGQPLRTWALASGTSGGAGDDFMAGTAGADTLAGNGGGDWMFGHLGADRLDGGAGDDQLVGDAGNDTLLGGSGSDALDGGAGADTLDGGTGRDLLAGGDGADVYFVDDATEQVIESATVDGSRDLVHLQLAAGPGTYALPDFIEDLQLDGSAAQDGIGNALDNRITGNAGANFLSGGQGVDTLLGGSGNDTYRIDDLQDVLVETAGGGTDTVIASISYRLGANFERLDFSGGTGALNGTGNELANTLIGTSDANVLDGGAGADTLIGGLGADLYVVDNPGDVLIESPFTDIDTVRSSVSFTLGADLDRLVLTGSTAINGTGNAQANTLTGNAAANVLDGGVGADTLVGGAGGDLYVVDNRLDVITETGPLASEVDSVRSTISWTLGTNLERLVLAGTANLGGKGNTLANTLLGNTGNNVLDGAAGADSLVGGAGNDTLVGGAGADLLNGGAGADVFRFASAPGAGEIDRLVDFRAVDDTVQLENAVFTVFTTPGVLAAGQFRAAANVHALDADDRVLYDTTSGALWIDADGNGAGAAVQIAWLNGAPALSAADFVIT